MSKINQALTSEKMKNLCTRVMFAVLVTAPSIVFATPAGPTADDAEERVCGFFTNINQLLNVASIAVVTIAVIFAGYQIAFAHKRIADVAPILIGGLLIGAAGQIAKMLIGGTDQCMVLIDTVSTMARYA